MQERLFWLSTWNEFGEGTYIMPVKAKLGFSYLDEIRSVFTSEKTQPYHHIVPTKRQQDRICNLYPRIGDPLVRSTR